jgi:hypothetical protein
MKPARAALNTRNNPYRNFIEGEDPIRVLSATYRKISKLLEGLTARQVTRPINKDKWSISEIIGHLADEELVFSVRSRWMAFQKNPVLVSFDQEAWAHGHAREKEPVADTLERFRVLRQSQLRLFRSIPQEDFSRFGTHDEYGKIVFGDYIAWVAGHDLNHLVQITDLRAKILEREGR